MLSIMFMSTSGGGGSFEWNYFFLSFIIIVPSIIYGVQFMIVVSMVFSDQFECKKDFFMNLIPFYPMVKAFIENFKEMK